MIVVFLMEAALSAAALSAGQLHSSSILVRGATPANIEDCAGGEGAFI